MKPVKDKKAHKPSCESWIGDPCNCGSGAKPPKLDAMQQAWAAGVKSRRAKAKKSGG